MRRCHGDLHLRNIALIDGEPTPFDAIEFDETIATGDILYDLAFAVMDLWERDLRRQANLLFNAYLASASAETLCRARRAAAVPQPARGDPRQGGGERVRRAREARRRDAISISPAPSCEPAPPRLVAVGGLSGTGKSALCARRWRPRSAGAGAVWLRSDIERKHLFGVDELTPLPDAAYSAAATAETYARLIDKARRALGRPGRAR